MAVPQPDWGIALVLLPLAAALVAFLRRTAAVAFAGAAATVAAAAGLTVELVRHGPYHHAIGGWGAPLGIGLHADGLSLLMVWMTAVVGALVTLYAAVYFREHPERAQRFWPLWLFLWSALNALFLGADIFNLYVTLELVGLAAAALTALAGDPRALNGAMRYLLVSLLGSLLYLLGVALLYHAYGTVDIALLGQRLQPGPASHAALAVITAGLLLKTALFPLHFWLPPAHASAPTPVSALLSALVVKGSFYLLLRLWLELFAAGAPAAAPLLGSLGAAAILWGSVQALRQHRLKLLVAYSTVAQLGYFFLAYPLLAAGGGPAWSGMIYLVLSHAPAKAAMFLAAGNILQAGGHDRIAELDRLVQRLPMSMAAFGIAGISIMGLPPSGGFLGKWLLLEAAIGQGHWLLAAVMVAGGLLAAAYVFRVVGYAFTRAHPRERGRLVPPALEWTALALALGAIAIGLAPAGPLALLEIGAPAGAVGS